MNRSFWLNLNAHKSTFSSAIALLGAVSLGGCHIQKVQGNQHEKTTEIGISDFKGTHDQPVNQSPDQVEVSTETGGANDPAQANPQHGRGTITSGAGGLEFLDAKVGDISGHPIYVSSFFEPIQDRLIAIGQQSQDIDSWRNAAGKIINARLNGIIYDELLRAETLAALTPQQRVGLQSFLKDFRSNVLSENLGSKELANRRYLEEEGITLDEALRQKELDTLVGLTLYQEINRRINISWRDIKQRYERDIDKYQPPPTVTLQVIMVREPEGEAVDSITNRLNAGEDFSAIAETIENNFLNDTNGKIERELTEPFKQTKFYGPQAMNEAAWTLGVGEWTGPVLIGSNNVWIKYISRVQESMTLYEAQLEIQRELTQERRLIERQAYLEDLMERARVSSAEEIMFRLLYIAEQKYGPVG